MLEKLHKISSVKFFEEDGKGDSHSKDKKFNLSAKNKQEEGAFSGQYETFKLTSSLLEETKDEKGASSTKNDRFEDDEGDSATRNAHLDGPSHGKGNEDDGVIFCSSLAQHK
ncbi:hypothetical protein L6452_45216 [Arctium lappa]|nr:hypothetical protein L6452_45216 [Arctium lappa]